MNPVTKSRYFLIYSLASVGCTDPEDVRRSQQICGRVGVADKRANLLVFFSQPQLHKHTQNTQCNIFPLHFF